MLIAVLVIAVFAAFSWAYVNIVRPSHQRWGATHLDRIAELPVDALSPYATGQITHAVSIQAPQAAIWSWIVQMGRDRAGFYTYPVIDSFAGWRGGRERRINPEWQRLAVGDSVWISRRTRMIAAVVQPCESLVLVTPEDWRRIQAGEDGLDTMWAIALRPKPDGTTHVITRLRRLANPTMWNNIANFSFWEPVLFVAERKMLLTLKDLAERRRPQRLESVA